MNHDEWLFFAPRSNEKSRENFLATLDSGYPIKDVEIFLTEEERQILRDQRKLYIWGNQEGKKSSWEKMELGDHVAFYAKGEFVYVGRCILKKQSAEIAQQLWGNVPDRESTWEYVFFLDAIRPIKIPLEVIRELAGYKDNMVVQGFMPINEEGMDNILAKYGSLTSFFDVFSLGLEAKTYNILDKISSKEAPSAEDLDKLDSVLRDRDPDIALRDFEQRKSGEAPELVERKVSRLKRNQTIVREMKKKFTNKCQICGFTFQKKNGEYYSEVAHIRALSSKEIGVDTPSNLVVLCPNHHKMLDLGNLEIVSKTQYMIDGALSDLIEKIFE